MKIRGSTLASCSVAAAFFLCLLLGVTFPLTASAQLTPNTGGTALNLSPETPGPGEAFNVRVEAYEYDMSHASIRWSIDGVEQTDFADTESVELVAPALGEPMALRVVVTEPGGSVHTATHTFAPSAVELVVEGATRTPPFYLGRALPSEGSGVRLIALPSLYASSGTQVSPEKLVYTWTLGSRVARRGVGANVLETEMPDSRGLDVILSVETIDGTARHVSGTRVEAADPVVRFYEDSPLYGLSRVALPEEFTLLAPEISVRAEPFHTSRDLFANARVEWTLDGVPIENPNADQTVVTLRGTGGSGSSLVSFSVRNLSALLQSAAGSFVVYFTE